MNTRKKKLVYALVCGLMALVVINLLAYRYASVLDRIGDTSGRTALHWAARDGRISTVRKLLASGADVNSRSKSGYTPLRDAVCHGHTKTVEFLIANGAVVNARDYNHENTPLHLAAATGHAQIVRILLAAGADADAKNRHGETPLERAENSIRNLPYLVRLVEEKGLKECIEVLLAHAASSSS